MVMLHSYLFRIEKTRSFANVSNTTGSPDTVNIFVNISWQIEVNHVLHIRNILGERNGNDQINDESREY